MFPTDYQELEFCLNVMQDFGIELPEPEILEHVTVAEFIDYCYETVKLAMVDDPNHLVQLLNRIEDVI